jgi:hypothetical protein
LRRFPARLADDAPIGLDEALHGLRTGDVCSVQLRYAHAGELWLDTLMVTPQGIRLVRRQAPDR